MYQERDPYYLEPHFSKHMEAMTAEGLFDKGEIAAELAYRDHIISLLVTAGTGLHNWTNEDTPRDVTDFWFNLLNEVDTP